MFAMAGTVVAADAGMNIVGCGLVGAITAMGGGTVSNLLCGQTPVVCFPLPLPLDTDYPLTTLRVA
jgi:uncharacterized membrane protein YeiH